MIDRSIIAAASDAARDELIPRVLNDRHTSDRVKGHGHVASERCDLLGHVQTHDEVIVFDQQLRHAEIVVAA